MMRGAGLFLPECFEMKQNITKVLTIETNSDKLGTKTPERGRRSVQYGEIIRRRRTALGMNQADLAAKAGVSRNTVAGWETNHSRPDLNTLPALCAALKISLNTFFGVGKKRTAEEAHVLEVYFSMEERDRESILWQMEALRDRRAAIRRG